MKINLFSQIISPQNSLFQNFRTQLLETVLWKTWPLIYCLGVSIEIEYVFSQKKKKTIKSETGLLSNG